MRLKIDNIAKIKHADIKIDGITVIAGENNTGKSTVGKVLYASFNSMYDINHRIQIKKREQLYKVCYDMIINMITNGSKEKRRSLSLFAVSKVADNMTDELLNSLESCSIDDINEEFIESALLGIINKILQNRNENLNISNLDEYIGTISKLLKSDDSKVALELISRVFLQVFDSQIEGLYSTENNSSIQLSIKNQNLILNFDNNNCTSKESDIDILHEAFFLDDPFIIDDLYDNRRSNATSTKAIRYNLADRLRNNDSNVMEGIFEAVVAKDNLREIFGILNEVTPGDLIVTNGVRQLKTNRFAEPINVENLSTGLKSFLVIKMMLEKGILKEKDVLILDEPEIHLHPDWQLKYAEIIVLLQKKFDLSILVTTHSRDFLEAIELYSEKYHIDSRCNYYLSKIEDEMVCFENVTGSLEKIYRQMITASMLLDDLRYSLDEENE